MDDLFLVAVVDSLDHLPKKISGVILRQMLIWWVNNLVEKFSSLEKFHDKVKIPRLVVNLIKLDHVWVIKSLENIYLIDEFSGVEHFRFEDFFYRSLYVLVFHFGNKYCSVGALS